MNRIHGSGFRHVITTATQMIPERIRELSSTDFLCGADPIFVGLHRFESASYGRSYRDTAHCVEPQHQLHAPRSQRRTTIVLPSLVAPSVVVHEMGHVLHARLAHEHRAQPVSWYASTDHFEAFAEAFTSWLIPGYAARPDDATIALLERLASE